jgi:hypothetical protein
MRAARAGASLLDVGGFDPTMAYGEDEELNWRLRQRGVGVMLRPALRQLYRPRGTLGGLWWQYWNYGRGRMRVLRKHPDFLAWRHLAPSALVVAQGGLGAIGARVPAAHTALALVAASWARSSPRRRGPRGVPGGGSGSCCRAPWVASISPTARGYCARRWPGRARSPWSHTTRPLFQQDRTVAGRR